MNKETDGKCQVCRNFDMCTKNNSQGCQQYEFYKCETCIDRTVENNGIPKCFRGGTPCSEIKYCSIGDR